MMQKEYYEELAKRIHFKDGIPYWNKSLKLAGTIDSWGYRKIGLSLNNVYKKIATHRLHWYIIYKNIPKTIDHIDRDPDNNAIDNLRKATNSQNARNTKPWGKSKYKGVCWDKSRQLWRAGIFFNKKYKQLGRFANEKDAAVAYNKAAIKFGLEEFTNMNEV